MKLELKERIREACLKKGFYPYKILSKEEAILFSKIYKRELRK